jgi:hypothetical protein
LKKEHQILKNTLENTWGQKIVYSKDCNDLADDIYQKIRVKISSQTLRRAFEFIKDGVTISKTTLHYLANYCGYNNFDELLAKNTGQIALIDDKDLKYIKLFYSITPIQSQEDDNYHNASKNISQILYKKPELLNYISTYLSQSKAAQIYFFERFPFIDKLATTYQLHIKKYLKEKVNAEAQLFDLIINHLHPYWKATGQIDQSLDWSQGVKVQTLFPEQYPLVRRSEIVDVAIKELNSGLITKKLAVQRLNPEMTEEEVDKLLAEIDAERVIELPEEESNDQDEENRKETEEETNQTEEKVNVDEEK